MITSPLNAESLFSRGARKHVATFTRHLAPFLPLAVLGAFLCAITVACAPASAQNVMSWYSQNGSVTASTASYDFRYTKHVVSSGGRGSRPYVYYSWDAHFDQGTTQVLPLPLNLSQRVTTAGTFYGPTYSATAGGRVSVTNTPTQAILRVDYAAATTVTTVLGTHQSVTATLHPASVFTFTVPGNTDVTLSAFGDPGGFVYLMGNGTILQSLSGTGGPFVLDTPLLPGTYEVSSDLTYGSGTNTQGPPVMVPGKTATSWGFTLSLRPNGDTGVGGAGAVAGDTGGN